MRPWVRNNTKIKEPKTKISPGEKEINQGWGIEELAKEDLKNTTSSECKSLVNSQSFFNCLESSFEMEFV